MQSRLARKPSDINFDSSGRSLAQMEQYYTGTQLWAIFLRAYFDHVIIRNTSAVQYRSTAMCGRYAVLVGRLFIEEEGSLQATSAC